jgi:hypothetical protein
VANSDGVQVGAQTNGAHRRRRCFHLERDDKAGVVMSPVSQRAALAGGGGAVGRAAGKAEKDQQIFNHT